jgi:LPPG:FO 2-phospho-L-lactate transferase
MVKLRGEAEVLRIEFEGAESARPAPGVIEAIREAKVLIIAPSNPFVSVGPILAVPGIREAVEGTTADRVAISPIIAGEVVKGPAARMLRSLGHEVSATAVASIYRGLIDVFVLDEQDRNLVGDVEGLGMRCIATDTMMTSDQRKAELAADVLAAVGLRP